MYIRITRCNTIGLCIIIFESAMPNTRNRFIPFLLTVASSEGGCVQVSHPKTARASNDIN